MPVSFCQLIQQMADGNKFDLKVATDELQDDDMRHDVCGDHRIKI